MTAPTPEQMRALADDAAAAAADTEAHPVDRVQYDRYAETLRAAADEVDRLRAAIENAPHDSLCHGVYVASTGHVAESPRHCTCWKADAL